MIGNSSATSIGIERLPPTPADPAGVFASGHSGSGFRVSAPTLKRETRRNRRDGYTARWEVR